MRFAVVFVLALGPAAPDCRVGDGATWGCNLTGSRQTAVNNSSSGGSTGGSNGGDPLLDMAVRDAGLEQPIGFRGKIDFLLDFDGYWAIRDCAACTTSCDPRHFPGTAA